MFIYFIPVLMNYVYLLMNKFLSLLVHMFWVLVLTGNGCSPSWITNPSTRWVRTCCPSGHALGSQGPLSDWLKLSNSSSDWPGASGSVPGSAGGGRDSLCDSVLLNLCGSCCGRLRSVGWSAEGAREGAGFSDGGVMKGEDGGDWEDRLDKAGQNTWRQHIKK